MKKMLMRPVIFIFMLFLLIGTASAATSTSSTGYKELSAVHFKDIIVNEVSVPVKGVKGCKIDVSSTVKNKGNIATGGFYVNYFLKTSSTGKEQYLGHVYIDKLAAGAVNHQNIKLHVPTNTAKASYYLLAHADSDGNISESNENNNYCYSRPKIKIVGPAYILFDDMVGGDVTLNSEINDNIPKTDFARNLFRMERNGSIMLKFGNGNGPKVLISAGIHGNEPEANIAIMEYLEYIKDKNIQGTLCIIPFAIPKDTALNSRYYNGKDPNRIANENGTPGWNIVQFARKNGIDYILDVHSGAEVCSKGLLYLNPSSTDSMEYKWADYITRVSGCESMVQTQEPGMVRTEASNYSINTITLEVERDSIPTRVAAETEFKIICAACKYFEYPSPQIRTDNIMEKKDYVMIGDEL